jgi:hypothetical protein
MEIASEFENIELNYGEDHIFKIICGAGSHSINGEGKIKSAIKEML